jgi:hypothetical protein
MLAPSIGFWSMPLTRVGSGRSTVGYLDAHHLASVNDGTRSLPGAGPDMDRAITRDAHLDRDQLIAYILEHLATDL